VCSLLTTDEIKAATGLAFIAQGDVALTGGKECNWQLEPGKNSAGVAFKRFVDVSSFGKPYFDAAASTPGAEKVPGIADDAVFSSDMLVVLKGDRSFGVVVNLHDAGLGTAETTAAERAAESALGKLVASRF
jgi:hypothetical protein